MIRSMTGYGSASGRSGRLEIRIELRSVNNRYLDVNVRLPRPYLFVEESLKKQVSEVAARGRMDVFVSVMDAEDSEVEVAISRPLAEAYVAALRTLQDEFGLAGDITAMQVAKLPEVLQVQRPEPDQALFTEDILAVMKTALCTFNDMREREGEKLRQDILNRLEQIESLATRVEALSRQTVTAYRAKLEKRMSEVLQGVHLEEGRILAEAALFADRVAIDEEITRLGSHAGQVRDVLRLGGAVGRKLDFLQQELTRETNTVGAKCNDLEISKLVIALKAEIEKIREQAQNIE